MPTDNHDLSDEEIQRIRQEIREELEFEEKFTDNGDIYNEDGSDDEPDQSDESETSDSKPHKVEERFLKEPLVFWHADNSETAEYMREKDWQKFKQDCKNKRHESHKEHRNTITKKEKEKLR